MERNKTLDIIISVVIAIVLWAYIITVVNPPISSSIRQVPVNITGEEHLAEDGLALASKQSYYVDLRINGLRKDVSELNASDFVATADVSTLQMGERNMTVTVTGPRSITVEEISPARISVLIDKLVSVEKPVNIIYEPGDDGELTLLDAPSSVVVVGAESDVARVAQVDFTIDGSKLAKDEQKILNLKGVLKNESGYELSNVSCENETYAFDVVLYETKTVALDIVLEGMAKYGEGSIETIEHTPAVKLKGPSALLAGISGITETVDVTGIAEDVEFEVEIHVPKGLYLSRDAEKLRLKIKISEQARLDYEAEHAGENEDNNKG